MYEYVIEKYKERHKKIKVLLSKVEIPDGMATQILWNIGANLGVTGPTVKNYISGNIKDGYLAEAIYNECKRLRFIQKN